MTTSNWQTSHQQQINTSDSGSTSAVTHSTETDNTPEWGDADIELMPSGD